MTSNISDQAFPPLAVGRSCKCKILGYLQGSNPTPTERLQVNGTSPTAWGAWQSPHMLAPRTLLARGCKTHVQDIAGASVQTTQHGQCTGGWKSWFLSQTLPNPGNSQARLCQANKTSASPPSRLAEEHREGEATCCPISSIRRDRISGLGRSLLAEAAARCMALLLLSWVKVFLSPNARPCPSFPTSQPWPLTPTSVRVLRVWGSWNSFTCGCYWQKRICNCSLSFEDSMLPLWGISYF